MPLGRIEVTLRAAGYFMDQRNILALWRDPIGSPANPTPYRNFPLDFPEYPG